MDQKSLRSENCNFWIENSRQLQFLLPPQPTPKGNRDRQIIANSSHLNLTIRSGNSIENVIFSFSLRKKYIFNSVISFLHGNVYGVKGQSFNREEIKFGSGLLRVALWLFSKFWELSGNCSGLCIGSYITEQLEILSLLINVYSIFKVRKN